MKSVTIISVMLILFSRAFAQDYSHAHTLLVSKYAYYIVIQDSLAYFDTWGGKKNPTYIRIDTLEKASESQFTGKSWALNAFDNQWLLKNLYKNSKIRFRIATEKEYKRWVELINWQSFKNFANEIRKFSGKDERVNRDLDYLFQKSITLSIKEYNIEINNFRVKYGAHD